jgi:hypothetical protein
MRAIRYQLVAAAVLALNGLSDVRADEEKVPINQLPEAVLKAVRDRFPNAQVVDASKETEEGKTEYEVGLKDGGKKLDVMLTPEGGITAIEKTIPVKGLPEAVKLAIGKKYPDAPLKRTEEIIKVKDGQEKLDGYEVVVETSDKKRVELNVGPDGTITGIERTIAVSDLPEAVRVAVSKKYPDSSLKKAHEIIKVKDGQETVDCYEAVIETSDKKKMEVKVNADGRMK